MESHVFIITDNESHWGEITNSLRNNLIYFYPKTTEEFNQLRRYCYSFSGDDQEVVTIKKIINDLPEECFCLIKYQIIGKDAFPNKMLFPKFYENFLLNKPWKKLIVYFEHGDNDCLDCCTRRKEQEKRALDFCVKNRIPYYYWRDPRHFVKSANKFIPTKDEELSIIKLFRT